MAPEDLVMPNDKFTECQLLRQISDGGRKLLKKYRDWTFRTCKKPQGRPLLVDWLDPKREVGRSANFQYLDFSEKPTARISYAI